ncbi:hypothetical protein CV102_08940 [Natronococcus pandeyae]|uniref:Uncharacterized protein n=1 Tax=Natronococcus pandeyae TaxID=2055836 RepID=A0A8J8TRB7_9EURY|nr:hypothetical protein CV102_08940 [Natronococcus pandeyae]
MLPIFHKRLHGWKRQLRCRSRSGTLRRADRSHAFVRLDTLLRGAALLGSTPYAGLMMLLASQDFRRA